MKKLDGDAEYVWMAKKWMEDQAQGRTGTEFEAVFVQNLRPVRIERGLIQCNFVVPKSLSDKDGNWHVGAIATLIDIVGFAATLSSVGNSLASVDFNISYFSTAKINFLNPIHQEEVEIEAKVMGHKGKLSSNMVEVRKKENGEMIAVGKQWMTSITLNRSPPSKL